MKVKFYIKRESDTDYTDLESYFNGMKYSKCVGLEDLGKPKNIYTETYSDADSLRVHIPKEVKRDATDITFTFIFFGEDRKSTYDRFNEFIKGQKLYYYDTARYKQSYMVLIDKTEPKEDVYKGSIPYMSVDYKFQNIWGHCKRIHRLELTANSSIAVIGKSISFSAKFDGETLDAGELLLFIDGKFEKNGVAGTKYIVYQPTSIGTHYAQVKYNYNDILLTSNTWEFFVKS